MRVVREHDAARAAALIHRAGPRPEGDIGVELLLEGRASILKAVDAENRVRCVTWFAWTVWPGVLGVFMHRTAPGPGTPQIVRQMYRHARELGGVHLTAWPPDASVRAILGRLGWVPVDDRLQIALWSDQALR